MQQFAILSAGEKERECFIFIPHLPPALSFPGCQVYMGRAHTMSIAAACSGRNDFRLISRRPVLDRVDIIKNLGVLCGSSVTAKLHVKLGRVGRTRARARATHCNAAVAVTVDIPRGWPYRKTSTRVRRR